MQKDDFECNEIIQKIINYDNVTTNKHNLNFQQIPNNLYRTLTLFRIDLFWGCSQMGSRNPLLLIEVLVCFVYNVLSHHFVPSFIIIIIIIIIVICFIIRILSLETACNSI